MTKVLTLLTVALLSSLALNTHGKLGQAGSGSSHSIVPSQRYSIRGTKNYTAVEAEVSYHHLQGDTKVSYPRSVEFNGTLMKNEPLDASKEIEGGCPRDESLPAIAYAPSPVGKSTYTLVQEGYKTENEVVVTGESGERLENSITFKPVEFAQPNEIVLSRSRDNLIKLRGKLTPKDDAPDVGIRQGDRLADGTAIRYDREADVLRVPAKALRKLRRGRADFWLTSSEGGLLDSPGWKSTGSYVILYTDTICARVVD